MKITTTIRGSLRYTGIFLFGCILLLSLSHFQTIYQPFVTLIIFILAVWIGRWLAHLQENNSKKVLIGLLIFGGGIRFLWAIFVPTLPVSDFEYFHRSALELSKGMLILTKNWGYPFLLSLGYRIYPDVLTGKIINAFASTLSLLLLYAIGKKLGKPSVGLVAVFLFAILPSEINMVSVLGTEVVGASIVLIVAFLLLYAIKSNTDLKQITAMCLAGLFYGLGLMIRTSLVFYFPIIVLVIFLACQSGKYIQRIKVVSVFLSGMVLGVSIIVMGYSLIGRKLSLAPLGMQDSLPFLTGTSINHAGSYNDDDANLYYSWPTGQRDELARQEAFRRITSDPIGFLRIIPQKFAILFGNNEYGNEWSLDAIDWGPGNNWGIHAAGGQNWGIYANLKDFLLKINRLLSQAVYCVIWFFAFYAFTRKNIPKISLIILGLLIFTLLPHMVVEVQGRYHSYIMPLIVLQAAIGFSKPGDETSSTV